MRFSTLVLLTVWPVLSFAQPAAHDVPSVTVVGRAEMVAVPDMARVSVGVTTQAATVAESLEQKNERTRRVMDELKKQGVATRDIQTSRFDVSPQYNYDRQNNQRSLIGYRVTNRVDVVVRDLDKTGVVLDAVVSAGANEVFGLSFDLADSDELLDGARRGAMADARDRAELYAKEAGLSLGPALQISEHTTPAIGPRPVMAARMESMSDAVPVAPGELKYAAEVRVTYQLEGGD